MESLKMLECFAHIMMGASLLGIQGGGWCEVHIIQVWQPKPL